MRVYGSVAPSSSAGASSSAQGSVAPSSSADASSSAQASAETITVVVTVSIPGKVTREVNVQVKPIDTVASLRNMVCVESELPQKSFTKLALTFNSNIITMSPGMRLKNVGVKNDSRLTATIGGAGGSKTSTLKGTKTTKSMAAAFKAAALMEQIKTEVGNIHQDTKDMKLVSDINQKLDAFAKQVAQNPSVAIEAQLASLTLEQINQLIEILDEKKNKGNQELKMQALATAFFGTDTLKVETLANDLSSVVASCQNLMNYTMSMLVQQNPKVTLATWREALIAHKNVKLGQSGGSASSSNMEGLMNQISNITL